MTGSKRKKTVFVCGECGGTSPAWSGKCPHCLQWNSLVEETIERSSGPRQPLPDDSRPVVITEIRDEGADRITTGIEELDRVLGDGIFPGSMNLIGGEPGIGKSTLMLQLAMSLSAQSTRVLYASGEESPGQIADRARRIGVPGDGLVVLPATNLDAIEREIEGHDYPVLIVDSIQTVYSTDISSSPGSVSQLRYCASRLLSLTKPRGITSFVVGHVTKEGSLAGPKVLEHLVDAVVYFEGDGTHSYRLLRVTKNRFGSTNELGVFEMTASGLVCVSDASGYFLRRDGAGLPGTAVVAIMEGTRPFLVEIQALTSHTRYGYPQRSANGFDSRRLPMLLAVLEKRCGMELGSQDIYVNVAGGVSLRDPGADLGVCLAVASSRLERPVRKGIALCGEVGLGGEIRPVAHFDRRLSEALRLGFTTLAGSALENQPEEREGVRGYTVISSAIEQLLDEPVEGGFRA
jgi:DNA repair protein RadA/Sms